MCIRDRIKIPLELFVHDAGTGSSIMQNEEAIKRLANVESITNVEGWRARQSPSRGTSRFDVHVVYERKIDVASERERLTKELEKIEKETINNRKQLGNDQFLAKAPPKVVEGLRKRAEELSVLHDKTKSKLEELGRQYPK